MPMIYVHPAKKRVPAVSLSLAEFLDFVDKVAGNAINAAAATSQALSGGHSPSISVQFRATDGSSAIARSAHDINPADERIPSIIVNPIVTVSGPAATVISMGPINEITSEGKISREYSLTVSATSQVLAVGILSTCIDWLRRKQKLFHKTLPYSIAAAFAVGVGSVAAAVTYYGNKGGTASTLLFACAMLSVLLGLLLLSRLRLAVVVRKSEGILGNDPFGRVAIFGTFIGTIILIVIALLALLKR